MRVPVLALGATVTAGVLLAGCGGEPDPDEAFLDAVANVGDGPMVVDVALDGEVDDADAAMFNNVIDLTSLRIAAGGDEQQLALVVDGDTAVDLRFAATSVDEALAQVEEYGGDADDLDVAAFDDDVLDGVAVAVDLDALQPLTGAATPDVEMLTDGVDGMAGELVDAALNGGARVVDVAWVAAAVMDATLATQTDDVPELETVAEELADGMRDYLRDDVRVDDADDPVGHPDGEDHRELVVSAPLAPLAGVLADAYEDVPGLVDDDMDELEQVDGEVTFTVWEDDGDLTGVHVDLADLAEVAADAAGEDLDGGVGTLALSATMVHGDGPPQMDVDGTWEAVELFDEFVGPMVDDEPYPALVDLLSDPFALMGAPLAPMPGDGMGEDLDEVPMPDDADDMPLPDDGAQAPAPDDVDALVEDYRQGLEWTVEMMAEDEAREMLEQELQWAEDGVASGAGDGSEEFAEAQREVLHELLDDLDS